MSLTTSYYKTKPGLPTHLRTRNRKCSELPRQICRHIFRSQRTTFSQRLCFVMVLRVQIVSDQIRYNLKLKQSYQFLKRDKGVKVRAEWRMLDCKATNRSLLRQFEPIQLSTTQDSKIDVIKEVKFRQFEPIQLHNPWF